MMPTASNVVLLSRLEVMLLLPNRTSRELMFSVDSKTGPSPTRVGGHQD